MKKFFAIVAIAGALVSCADNTTETRTSTGTETVAPPPPPAYDTTTWNQQDTVGTGRGMNP